MNDLFNTPLYQNAELRNYDSSSQLNAATGVPKAIIKLAKKKNLPGFKSNNRIDWSMLKPALEERWDDLQDEGKDDISYWKLQIAKRDSELKALQIKKLQRNMMEPEEVKSLLLEIATNQSVILKSELDSLPHKIIGRNEGEIREIINKLTESIFNKLIQRTNEIKT